jgi:hypothetical protein
MVGKPSIFSIEAKDVLLSGFESRQWEDATTCNLGLYFAGSLGDQDRRRSC